MKFFKKKNLLNVLYAVLIALPLFSILGRVLYTQWNQNAKDSYYGETINESQNIEIQTNNLKLDNDYKLYIPIQNTISGSFRLNFNGDVKINNVVYNNYSNIEVFNNGGTPYFGIYGAGQNTVYLYLNTTSIDMDFNFNSLVNNNSTLTYQFYETVYNNFSYLDNAFDYSISQFVSENDFGKLNFFTWFSDLFLSNNSVNNLYIHFVNWYLNYTLYVSLGYILWLVLMWFVSFIRRLLEKTSTYETGGF